MNPPLPQPLSFLRQATFAFLIALTVLATPPSSAQDTTTNRTFFVDTSHPEADDANPGTETQPWKTIRHAASLLQPGDTVYVKAGNYPENIRLQQSGNEGRPIVFAAWKKDVVVIGGDEKPELLDQADPPVPRERFPFRIPFSFRLENLKHVSIEGFIIERVNQGIYVQGCESVTIRNCTVRFTGQEAIRFRESSHCLAENNLIHDIVHSLNTNGEGFYIGSPPEQGIDFTHNIVIRGNTIFHTIDEGIELKPNTHDCVIEDNIVRDLEVKNGGGINAHRTTHYPDPPNHLIQRNTVSNISTSSQWQDGNGIRAGTDTTVINNVVFSCQHFGIRVDDMTDRGYPARIEHNTLFNNRSGPLMISQAANANVIHNLGPDSPSNLPSLGSYFVAPDQGNFSLVRGSAPIDLAENSELTEDRDKSPRPVGSAADFGAYEFRK